MAYTNVPRSYREWLAENCSFQPNPLFGKGIAGQQRYIVLSPQQKAIGTADCLSTCSVVSEMFANAEMFRLSRDNDFTPELEEADDD